MPSPSPSPPSEAAFASSTNRARCSGPLVTVSGQDVALAAGLMLVGVGRMLLEEELDGPWPLVSGAARAKGPSVAVL